MGISMDTRILSFALGCFSLLTAPLAPAFAADYPTRRVRWVVAFPASGANDIVARLIEQSLSERLGQNFII